MMDYERSLAIAQKMGWHFTFHRCWENAVQALRLCHKHLGNALYVEGWYACPDMVGAPLVQPHGWLELEDGTILDPPYAMTDHEAGKRFHHEYFPVHRYRLEELKGVRCASLPLVYKKHGWGGRESEEYQAAMVNAYLRIGIDIRQPNRSED